MLMYFIILTPATAPLSWINGNIHGGEAAFLNRWHRCIRLERKNDRKDRQKGRYLIDSAICQSAGNFKSLFGILHHSSLLRKNVCFENLNVALKQNLSANLRQIFQDTNVQVWFLTLARRGLMTRGKKHLSSTLCACHLWNRVQIQVYGSEIATQPAVFINLTPSSGISISNSSVQSQLVPPAFDFSLPLKPSLTESCMVSFNGLRFNS